MIFASRRSRHARSCSRCEPGDLIATGTPAGVGSTEPDEPARDGDEMVIEIERIGRLTNRCRVWGEPKADEA